LAALALTGALGYPAKSELLALDWLSVTALTVISGVRFTRQRKHGCPGGVCFGVNNRHEDSLI